MCIIADRDTGWSKSFAFVERTSVDAEKAIPKINGTELDGRSLTVNEARPREDRSSNRGRTYLKRPRYLNVTARVLQFAATSGFVNLISRTSWRWFGRFDLKPCKWSAEATTQKGGSFLPRSIRQRPCIRIASNRGCRRIDTE
ncbi:MAG TPA: hypothetical protein VFQ92_11005 [Blastocatellia bacterium]|nr:hypothetical protein [Blastocatellia bacterium]